MSPRLDDRLSSGSRQVLDHLRRSGPRSRAELQGALGFSRMTITGWVQPLLEDGLVVEQDTVPSRGRPVARLAFAPSRGRYLIESMETTRSRTALTEIGRAHV